MHVPLSYNIKIVCDLLKLLYHTGQELSCYFLNCVKGSEGILLTPATWGTTPNIQANHRILVFGKKSFFTIFESQKCIIFYISKNTNFAPGQCGIETIFILLSWRKMQLILYLMTCLVILTLNQSVFLLQTMHHFIFSQDIHWSLQNCGI